MTIDTGSTAAIGSAADARCSARSGRDDWDVDHDVIRNRRFDFNQRFLPEALARSSTLDFLSDAERRLLNQVQGRSHANMLGFFEGCIKVKVLDIGREQGPGNPRLANSLLRMADDALKHQTLFRRADVLAAEGMPGGYRFVLQTDAMARMILSAPPWSLLALVCHADLCAQAHLRHGFAHDAQLSPLFGDILLCHGKAASRHAIVDEGLWRREHARLDVFERGRAVSEFSGLLCVVDGLLQAQAAADAGYVIGALATSLDREQRARLHRAVLTACRWRHILSGLADTRFGEILAERLTPEQRALIRAMLRPLQDCVGAPASLR